MINLWSKFKNQNTFNRVLIVIGIFLLGIVISATLFYQAVGLGFFGKLYSKEEIKNFENELATQVLSEDGELLGKFFDKNRINVKYQQLPKNLVNALVATEDARFFEHDGVDSRSLLRVIVKSIILNDNKSGGGSTLTQQLAKNMYGRKYYGWITMPVNKCKEIILSNRLESVFTKEEIITLYFNTVPFGEGVYGIESAAQKFFGVSVDQLSIEQSAVLVGMLKANTYYNPRLNPNNAFLRRNVVFTQMNKYDYLSDSELDSLKELPLKLNYNNLKSKGVANYFLAKVRRQANRIIEDYNQSSNTQYNIDKDGLVIKTTLNYQLQQASNNAFKSHLSQMQKHLNVQYNQTKYFDELRELGREQMLRNNLKDSVKRRSFFSWDGGIVDSSSTLDSIMYELKILQAGMIALNPQTGAVLTWVGGIDYQTQPYDQITAKRQLASTFKPLLYASAIENGRMPCDYIDNSAFSLSDYEGWSPENYDHSEGGKYSIAAALANSKNIPSIRLYFETGFDEVNYLWKKMGFSGVLVDEPSLALGTATASIFELATAYSTFANGGFIIEPFMIHSIATKEGNIIYKANHRKSSEAILKEKTIILTNAILQKAIKEGTGTPMHQKYGVKIPMAGKTGTSQGYSDAWFVGYNPSIIMVSRVGANNPAIHFNSGTYGSGGRLALPLVAKALLSIQKDRKFLQNINTHFNPLPNEFFDALDCEDYKPDSKVSQFFKSFQSKETTLEKEERKAKRNKNNLIKRWFNN